MKRYSSYSRSPVPWLDGVPSHWAAIRLDRLFRYRSEEPLESDGRVTGYLDGRVTLRSNVAGQKIKGVVYETGWQRVHVGDFAISGMNAHLGGMGVSDSEGKCSPIYMILEPLPGTNAHFVSLAVRHAAHLGAIKALVQTIRFNSADMKRADLKSIYVPLPTVAEQAQIVRFVRNLDSKVNRLIKAKRRLIELLNEQKQAIIHRAVTRGLDPTVPLKPSGIDWLGDIPSHWKAVPLKHLGSVRIGLTYSPADVTDEVGELVLRASNIRDGRIVHADNVYVSKDIPERLRVKEGDILICVRSGSRSLVGKSALITRDFEGMTYGAFMSLLRSPENRFLYWVLNSNLLPSVMAQFETSTINQLTQSDLRGLVVPLPASDERGRIVEFIENETATLDATMEKTRQEIELIREYRIRLVADVVTGQLDVRHLNLPEIEDTLIESIESTDLESDVDETDDVLEEAEV